MSRVLYKPEYMNQFALNQLENKLHLPEFLQPSSSPKNIKQTYTRTSNNSILFAKDINILLFALGFLTLSNSKEADLIESTKHIKEQNYAHSKKMINKIREKLLLLKSEIFTNISEEEYILKENFKKKFYPIYVNCYDKYDNNVSSDGKCERINLELLASQLIICHFVKANQKRKIDNRINHKKLIELCKGIANIIKKIYKLRTTFTTNEYKIAREIAFKYEKCK